MASFQLQPGTIFASDCRIRKPCSEGGRGAVYVAEQLSTRAERALKLMHPQLVRDPALRARFEQEAKIAAQISSDHVVQVIGAGVDAGLGGPPVVPGPLDGGDLAGTPGTGGSRARGAPGGTVRACRLLLFPSTALDRRPSCDPRRRRRKTQYKNTAYDYVVR